MASKPQNKSNKATASESSEDLDQDEMDENKPTEPKLYVKSSHPRVNYGGSIISLRSGQKLNDLYQANLLSQQGIEMVGSFAETDAAQ